MSCLVCRVASCHRRGCPPASRRPFASSKPGERRWKRLERQNFEMLCFAVVRLATWKIKQIAHQHYRRQLRFCNSRKCVGELITPSSHQRVKPLIPVVFITSFSDIIPGTVWGPLPIEITSTSSGFSSCSDSWELASASPSWAMLERLRLRAAAGWRGCFILWNHKKIYKKAL